MNVINKFHLQVNDKKWKISLNTHDGNKNWCYDLWRASHDTWFSHWSHYSIKANKKNFKVGDLCLGFVKINLNQDKWLLIEACKIIKVPNLKTTKQALPCYVQTLHKFDKYIGRTVVQYAKKPSTQNYVFKLSTIGKKLKVVR